MFYELKIRKFGCRNFQLCKMPIRFKRKRRDFNFSVNDSKLDNSISRAKSKIFDYAMNNDFSFFVTLTFNSSCDKYNLDSLRRIVSNLIINMRKNDFSNLGYILIPEKHKNGSYHFHGLFTDGFKSDFVVNDNGFFSWDSFSKYGFSSISKIDNYLSCCKYITKYINKDMIYGEKGQYLYFNSKGLKSSEVFDSFVSYGLLPLNFDFENQYVSKVLLNYDEFITLIDFLSSNGKIIKS